jgi:dTDP-4-amino-4,6-dideoxygalactose transaminase
MLLVSEPKLGYEEKTALSEVVDCGWITMGDRVRAFERTFSEIHGVADAVAVSSCTAALHIILQALGVGPGDEVLVPSLSFVATANCVLYVGATPVFVDIEALDWPLMSRADAAAKCSPKTKAAILMHYAGYVADRDAWRDFARSHGIFLIEDAAHAAGATDAGKLGHATAFSFYGNKNMTTAEGGMVTAADGELLNKIRKLRSHGMTSGTFERFSNHAVGYDVTVLGYNYRMDELRAAIGLVQLKNLNRWNEQRRRLTQLYLKSLKKHCPDICLPYANCLASSERSSSHHIMPVVLPENVDRQRVIDRLRDAGIQTSNHYPPIHRLSYYCSRFPRVSLPRTEDFAQRELTIPLHPKMKEWQVESVVMALAHAVNHTGQKHLERPVL